MPDDQRRSDRIVEEALLRDPARFTRATIGAIADDQLRDNPPVTEKEMATANETAWAITSLSEEGLDRLAVFLGDLARRAPFTNPVWAGHRTVIEALEQDIASELVKRRSNGQH
jgi:hypothetical protein